MRALVAGLCGALGAGGCRSHPQGTGTDASEAGRPVVVTDASTGPGRFSRPIAAARGRDDLTFVAGLVASRGAIAVTAMAQDGTTRWTHDVISGVAWSSNAALNLAPTPAGGVIVWRGLSGGRDVTLGAAFNATGQSAGDPFPVGAAACATDDQLLWIERGPNGTSLLRSHALAASAQVTALTLPDGRDPALLCGQHRGFVLGDGERDMTLQVVGVGAPSSTRIMADAEFGADEERGHETYTVADTLGLVRFGASGGVAVREASSGRAVPWRRLGHKLADGDDVTLVDADAHSALVVFTRDMAVGDAAANTAVEALVWDCAAGHDATYELAKADSTRDRAPFWSGAVDGGIVVGWAERAAGPTTGQAPVLGMSYVLVASAGAGEVHHVDRSADDMVDAGCDPSHCYAVALVRQRGEDGGSPETVDVIRYP